MPHTMISAQCSATGGRDQESVVVPVRSDMIVVRARIDYFRQNLVVVVVVRGAFDGERRTHA